MLSGGRGARALFARGDRGAGAGIDPYCILFRSLRSLPAIVSPIQISLILKPRNLFDYANVTTQTNAAVFFVLWRSVLNK